MHKIRANGGRFLKKVKNGLSSKGEVLYVDIGLAKAQEKTSQALREGAPELRRRKANVKNDGSIATLSSSSTLERTSNTKEDSHLYWGESASSGVLICTSSYDEEHKTNGVLSIEPSMIMLGRRHCPPISLPVDQLTPSERELYMNHFYPPNSAIEAKRKHLFGEREDAAPRHEAGRTVRPRDEQGNVFQGHWNRMPEETPLRPGTGEWPSVSVAI